MTEKQKSKPEHMLMEAIGFTEEDLAANREGYFTKRQRTRLSAKQSSWIILAFLIAVVGLFLAMFAVVDGVRTDATTARTVGLIFADLVVVAGLLSYIWLNWRRYNTDLRDTELRTVEGRVLLDVSHQGNSGNYYTVHVEDINFSINKPIFLAFKNGDPYHIYYAPHSKTILSAEWLREEL